MDLDHRIADFLAHNAGPCTYGYISLSLGDCSFQDVCAAIESMSRRGLVVTDYQGVRLANPQKNESTPSLEPTNPENEFALSVARQEEIGVQHCVLAGLSASNELIGAPAEKPIDSPQPNSDAIVDDLIYPAGLTQITSDGIQNYTSEPILGLDATNDSDRSDGGDSSEPKLERMLPWNAHDSVSALTLPQRARNALSSAGIETVEQLVRNLTDLSERKGLGRTSLLAIQTELSSGSKSLGFISTPEQIAALTGLSGSRRFVFDGFGFLCRIASPAVSDFYKPESSKTDVEAHPSSASQELAGVYDSIPIESLNLSEPTLRRLRQHGFRTAGALLQTTEEELLGLKQVGRKKVEEIRDALEILLSKNAHSIDNKDELWSLDGQQRPQDASRTILESLSHIEREASEYAFMLVDDEYPVYEKTFCICILPMIRRILEESQLSAIECAEEVKEALLDANAMDEACLRALEKGLGKAVSIEKSRHFAEPIQIPPTGPWIKAAKEIVNQFEWCEDDEMGRCIKLIHPDIATWVNSLDDRTASMIRMRLKGLTFDDCGKEFGITRARAQQICNKAFKKRPLLLEDRYAEFFSKYALDEDAFVSLFGAAPSVYRYLSITCEVPNSRKKPLHDALADDGVPLPIKTAVKKKLDEGYIYENETRIRIDKKAITEFLIQRYASDRYITIEYLIGQYETFLIKHGLSSIKRLAIKNPRAHEAYIDRIDVALRLPHSTIKTYGGNIRYYNPDSFDFSLLIQAVMSGVYTNIECSAMLLYNDSEIREVAELYDIQNGYELHYVLSRFCGNVGGLTFGNIPMLKLGTSDRRKQIVSLIEEMGPVSAKDLAEEYERRYGVDRATFQGTFLKGFDIYKHNGKYSFSDDSLSDEQEDFLRNLLEDDYVSLPILKARFEDKYPDAPPGAINGKSVSKLGYKPSEKLLVRSDRDERQLFVNLLDSTKRFALGDPGFPMELFENGVFTSELRSRLNALDLIEYKKNSFIKTSELEKLDDPVSKELLADFIEKALVFMESEKPYSIKGLINDGFTHPVITRFDDVGFDYYALASVLSTAYVGGRLKRTSINEVPLFCKTRYTFSVLDVFDSVLEEKECMEIDDLCDYINYRFGVDMGRPLARSIAKRSQLYFNEALDILFIDKDKYREKVSEWIC